MWHEAVSDGETADLTSTKYLKDSLVPPPYSPAASAASPAGKGAREKRRITTSEAALLNFSLRIAAKNKAAGRIKISQPFNMTHMVHVNFDEKTGFHVRGGVHARPFSFVDSLGGHQ